jgi:GNAT superfamily N-acetyltransferase
MEKIQNYSQIKLFIDKIKSYKEGYLTNFYWGEKKCNDLIKNDLLYTINHEKCIFLLSKDFDFYHLNFISTDTKQLSFSLKEVVTQYPDLTFVSDILGTIPNISHLTEIFEEAKFKKYKKLIRLNNLNQLFMEKEDDIKQTDYASLDQAYQIKNLLELYFDKYSEQLPLIEEIKEWINQKQILIVNDNDKIIGFIIFDINGLTSIIRYWFVHPDFRNKKLGSVLIKSYFYECKNTKRKLLWVIEDNDNAIVRYKHYGYDIDSMVDQIVIKNEHETTNY